MKQFITLFLVCALSVTSAMPVFANNYDFSTGEDTITGFGDPTSNDNPVTPDLLSQNTRRNKDNSDLPPPYFYGSGDIPTDTGSPYHSNLPGGESAGYGAGIAYSDSAVVSGGSNTNIVQSDGLMASTSMLTGSANSEEPKYNSDGTIGSLFIERTGKAIKVYEGE